MLEMGLVVAEVRAVGAFLIAFAIWMPIIDGTIGVLLGDFVGLSVGGATMLGVMAVSASYIATPAAMRISLPETNPSFYDCLLDTGLGVYFAHPIERGARCVILIRGNGGPSQKTDFQESSNISAQSEGLRSYLEWQE